MLQEYRWLGSIGASTPLVLPVRDTLHAQLIALVVVRDHHVMEVWIRTRRKLERGSLRKDIPWKG